MTFNTETNVTPIAETPDLMALVATGSHPGWVVLDAARDNKFTGEIIFGTQPEIRAYFDNGVAYHAVRHGDPSLCEQLLDAEIVDASQIERGVVRVGNVEHLGRMFDRDPSVDRDAATVLLEMATDAVLTDLANRSADSFQVTAYRHHASGIHRWFVAPDSPLQLSPVGHVAQLDGSITSNLPGLPRFDRDEDDRGQDGHASVNEGIHIEWNEPLLGADNETDHAANSALDAADQPAGLLSLDESMLQSILDDDRSSAEGEVSTGFTPDAADSLEPTEFLADLPADLAAEATLTDIDVVATGGTDFVTAAPLLGLDEFVMPSAPAPDSEPEPILAFDDDFQIVWPDGTEEPLPDVVDDIVESASAELTASETAIGAATTGDVEPELMPAPTIPTPTTRAEDDGADYRFEVPPLALEADLTPAVEQPDDVVDAVRRALEALETASTTSAVSAREPFATDSEPDETVLHDAAIHEPAARLDVFAPPTLDNSVEAIYSRVRQGDAVVGTEDNAAPVTGVASVVFVDDEATADGNERAGALRRLIGSIRRK